MKKIIFLIFAFVFVFTSCHKEEISFDRKEVIDPPTELDYAIFSGEIIHEGNGVADAEIFIYQKGKKLGKIVSDQNGKYTTESHSIEIGSDVTFEIKSYKYITKIKRLSPLKEINNNYDFNLNLRTKDIPLISELTNPGDTNLVKLYGNILDSEGKPVKNILCYGLWIVNNDTINKLRPSNLSFTNENGYFEVLVKPDVELFFRAFKFVCGGNVNDENTYGNGIPELYQYVGKIYLDTEINNLKNIPTNLKTIVRGRFLNCENTPVTKGKAKLWFYQNNPFSGKTGISYEINEFDANGNFSFSFESCGNGGEEINIKLISSNHRYGIDLKVPFKVGEINLGDIKVCKDFRQFPNYMTLKVGNVLSADSISLHSFTNSYNNGIFSARFKSDSLSTLSNKIRILNNKIYLDFGKGHSWGFKSEENEVKIINLDYTPWYCDNCMYVTFDGNVKTNDNERQDISGSFIYCRQDN